jgi:hypothetical protein
MNSIKHSKKNKNYEILEKALYLQSSDRVDGAPPLPLLPESAWRCWLCYILIQIQVLVH